MQAVVSFQSVVEAPAEKVLNVPPCCTHTRGCQHLLQTNTAPHLQSKLGHSMFLILLACRTVDFLLSVTFTN